MLNKTNLSLIAILSMSIVQADDTLTVANNFDEIFSKGKVLGQMEIMYSGHTIKNNEDPYSTAIGGQLKYETAMINGFSAGAEFTTVHEINGLSGDTQAKRATLMVSAEGSYTQLSQAYLDYRSQGLTVRLGRQLIDTPLADSDDYRIINNTFEAATLSYNYKVVKIMLGYLDRWQGTDAGLDNNQPWQDTGVDGSHFASMTLGLGKLDTSLWYYDISGQQGDQIGNISTYLDATLHLNLSDNFTLDTSAQYLNQSENDNSGIDADIYGLMLEATLYEKIGLQLAYNRRKADDDKTSFSGFGGGTLYTSLENMILDTIVDGDTDAIVAGISYEISDLSLYYMYGVYERDQTSTLAKEEIIEQNFGADYSVNENLTLTAVLTIDDNKENTDSNAIYTGGDFTNIRVSASYTF